MSINDTLDGGAGTDKLTAYLTGTALATGASITNIETIDIITTGAGFTIDASVDGKYANLKTLSVNAGAGAVAVTTKANATSVTVVGGTTVGVTDSGTTDTLTTVSVTKNTGAAAITSDVLTNLTIADTAQNATVTAAAATRTLNLTVNKLATGGTITDATATTLNVTATGADSVVTALSAAKATTVTFAGDKKLTSAGETFTLATSITSTNTAGITLGTELLAGQAFTSSTGADSVKVGATTKAINTGAGIDTVTLSGAALGAEGTVVGGDGRDTLVMTAANAVLASATTAVANFSGKVTGFEVLEVGAQGATSEIKLAVLNNAGWNTIDEVTFGGIVSTGALTLSDLASGGTINIRAANTASVTVLVKDATNGLEDRLNINVSSAGALAAGTVTAAKVENIVISVKDTDTTTHITGLTLVADAVKSITVSGDTTFTLANTNTTITSLDATAQTAKFTFVSGVIGQAATVKGSLTAENAVDLSLAAGIMTYTGGAVVDTITGGTLADVINAAAGDDIINGLGGIDSITTGAGADTVLFGTTAISRDTVLDFTASTGGDKIKTANYAAATDFVTLAINPSSAIAFTAADVDGTVLEFSFEGNAGASLGDGSANSLTGVNLLKALNNGQAEATITLTTLSAANVEYLVAYQGGKAFIYDVTDAGPSVTTIVAAELVLVGILDNIAVGALTSANFIA